MGSDDAWLLFDEWETFGWDDVGLIIFFLLVMTWYFRGGYRYFQ